MPTRRAAVKPQQGQLQEAEDDELTLIVEQVHRKMLADRAPRSNWGLMVQVVTMVTAVIGFVFSLGINYSRLSSAEARLSALEKKQEATDSTVQQVLTTVGVAVSKIDDLRSTVSEIKGQLQPASAAARRQQ